MSSLMALLASSMYKMMIEMNIQNYIVVTDLKDEFYFSEPHSNDFKSLKGDRVFTRKDFPEELVQTMKIGIRETLDEVLDSYNEIPTK